MPKTLTTFCPGSFIKEEMRARKWTIQKLSDLSGLSQFALKRIINGQSPIVAEQAIQLAQAFRTSPQVWLNLEHSWQLSKVTNLS
jgi:addiction module HigA family antidote